MYYALSLSIDNNALQHAAISRGLVPDQSLPSIQRLVSSSFSFSLSKHLQLPLLEEHICTRRTAGPGPTELGASESGGAALLHLVAFDTPTPPLMGYFRYGRGRYAATSCVLHLWFCIYGGYWMVGCGRIYSVSARAPVNVFDAFMSLSHSAARPRYGSAFAGADALRFVVGFL